MLTTRTPDCDPIVNIHLVTTVLRAPVPHCGTLRHLSPYRRVCYASIRAYAEARGERGGEVGDLVERHRGSAQILNTLNTA